MAPWTLAPRAPTPDRLHRGPAQQSESPFDDFYRAELPDLLTLAVMLAGDAEAPRVAQKAMLATCRQWEDLSSREDPHDFARRTCADLALSRHTRIGAGSGAYHFFPRPREAQRVSGWESDWATLRCLPKRDATTIALHLVYRPRPASPTGDVSGDRTGDGSGDRAVAELRERLMNGLDVDRSLAALHLQLRRHRCHRRLAELVAGFLVLAAGAAGALLVDGVANPAYQHPDEPTPPPAVHPTTALGTMDNGVIVAGDGIVWTADAAVPEVPNRHARTTMSFSPDGERLAYLRGRALRVMDTRVGDSSALGAHCGTDCEVAWSPNGSAIAVTGHGGIGRVTSVGQRIPWVVRGYRVDDLAWSPHGRRIAFAVEDGPRAGLWTVELDGGAPTHLRTPPRAVRIADLAWAPDGRTLAFVEQYSPRSQRPHLDVDTVSADGTGTTLLVSSPCRCGGTEPALAWSPDGTTVAVNAAFADLPMLETLDSRGRTVRILRLDARGPLAWQPIPPTQNPGPARRGGTRTSN